jgi:hypothetical protein
MGRASEEDEKLEEQEESSGGVVNDETLARRLEHLKRLPLDLAVLYRLPL